MPKSSTQRIVIFEPDEAQLKSALADRQISSGLAEFLKNLLKRKRWARKINIPSDHEDVAAVLVFTTTLKDGGVGDFQRTARLFRGPHHGGKMAGGRRSRSGSRCCRRKPFARSISPRFRVEGAQVDVEFSVPIVGGQSRTLVKTFDFSVEDSEVRIVPHPLLQIGSLDAEKHSSPPAAMS
ncbi:MAG: hypothetical protein WDN28_30255 [Chthoniobacter sp.]